MHIRNSKICIQQVALSFSARGLPQITLALRVKFAFSFFLWAHRLQALPPIHCSSIDVRAACVNALSLTEGVFSPLDPNRIIIEKYPQAFSMLVKRHFQPLV